MENDQKSMTFFTAAPKGKKISTVLSWIATVVLIAALFVPAFQVKLQMQNTDGKYEDVLSSDSNEYILGDMDQQTSVFKYLTTANKNSTSLSLSESGLTVETSGSSATGVVLLVLFAVLAVVAIVSALYTVRWVAFAANLIGVGEVLAVYFFVFKNKFSQGLTTLTTLLTGSRIVPALTPTVIVVLAAVVVLSVAAIIVSYAVHDEEVGIDWNPGEEGIRNDGETNLVGDSDSEAVAALIRLNTSESFAIRNNTETILGKGPQVDIVIENPIVSRTHAKIICHDGTCTIRDLGSKNGTFVGDQKLSENNFAVLTDGMYITLGNEMFQFKV